MVGSPVFEASYGGLLKHFLDLIDEDALRGRPVVLCVTGLLPEDGAMIVGRLLPLFAFFGTRPVEPRLYAGDGGFAESDLASERVAAEVEAAVAERGGGLRG